MYDIVAVDDCSAIRQFLGSLFEQAGWNACVLEHANEAIDVLDREGSLLLITDINLPGMTGAELAHTARELYPEMPIIALTASVRADELDQNDFTCILGKPTRMVELQRVLSEYLRECKNEMSESWDC